jgi:Acyl-protein synthetase, LuxE
VQAPTKHIEGALEAPLYGESAADKRRRWVKLLRALEQHHREHCVPYRMLTDALWSGRPLERVEDAPFLPVRLFKEYDLKSVPEGEVFKTMTSSGTTGAQVSKIYVDRTTAGLQTKALAKIVQGAIGNSRLPMLIVDSDDVVKNRAMFSARGAGILGFSMFGKKTLYALDANMALKREVVEAFVAEHGGGPVLLFGFTAIVWDHFCRQLREAGVKLALADATLIHGGGWKKLKDRAVSEAVFKGTLREVCGIGRVFNYYGMVEQTGSISMECERGFLHTNAFNDVVIRRAGDLAPAAHGERGIIQTLSALPLSYPGHSLLTEDEGVVEGEDDCACGRKGKYFRVLGRIARAELRGCSDTFTARAS